MASDELSGVHVWLVLWRATRAVEGYAHRSIAALAMCRSDFAVLEALLHKGPLPVNVIGEKVLLTSGSITTAVDRLEKRGLVERRNAPEDRRVRVVHLTPAGRQLIETVFADHAKDMERLIEVLRPEERATLVELLKKVGRKAAEALGRGPSGEDEAG
ncbi:MAG: MarR family transcriptional regulator [Isosphaeraceae bacterium]|nr:MarR family transcriptional regulator [Isosphaeraceae bacterium]